MLYAFGSTMPETGRLILVTTYRPALNAVDEDITYVTVRMGFLSPKGFGSVFMEASSTDDPGKEVSADVYLAFHDTGYWQYVADIVRDSEGVNSAAGEGHPVMLEGDENVTVDADRLDTVMP